jgi:NADH-quinone oxidoreductase subunit F
MDEIDLSLLIPVLTDLAPMGRTALLPALQAVQDLYGYAHPEAVREVGRALQVPLADIYGVIDFYSLFYTGPVGKTVFHVCGDPACAMAGSDGIFKLAAQKVEQKKQGGEIIETITVERSACLGLCEHAPALLVQGAAVGGASQRTWEEMAEGRARRPHSIVGGDISILTANCGHGHTTFLNEYRSRGGYAGLRRALKMSPMDVVEMIKASGLVGRGGAAFPTGIKWESAAKAVCDQKYVVVNADEAEPGTFKDRVMMEDDPNRVLEGLIIAAYSIGASKGYWYIRGEYAYSLQVVKKVIKEAKAAGILGENILDSGFDFDVEVRRGAGAYVCGEETALFESIEGKRGFPRIKPPFPTTAGLFGKPTVINNVETLSNIPFILEHGAKTYRYYGTEKSPGPKLFCISGDVVRPGLYEVPFGVTMRHLIFGLAGGMREGRSFKAALVGGAAGAFAVGDHLDTRMSFEDLRAAGLPLGSGVITVFDDTRDMKDILLRLTYFFAEESCGKCYPCQLGTQRQHEIMQRIAAGNPLPGDGSRLTQVGWTMTDASLCGLGQTAASALLSAIKVWPEIFMAEKE